MATIGARGAPAGERRGATARWRVFKPAVFLAAALPLAFLAADFIRFTWFGDEDALGIDPVKTLEDQSGKNALTLLLITLSITPLRRWTGINRLQSVRRLLGVWAFAYAAVHVVVYLAFDRSCLSVTACEYREIWTDVVRRRFIFAGVVAFTILTMLAVTSTSGWVRRLKKRWTTLHRFVYAAGVAAIVHFIWIQKSDIREPLWWGAYLVALLGMRVWLAVEKRRAHA